jgi:hypothetical protein
MPIEIKELHIRVSVNTTPGGQPAGQQATAGGSSSSDAGSTGDQDAIIAECVEQVLQILQDKMER